MGPLVLRRPATLIVTSALVASFNVVGATAASAGQQPPPIDGVTGTVATEESKKDVHEAGRGVLGKVGRLFGVGRRSSVPASPEGGEDTLAGMTTGTAVLIRTTTGGENTTAEEIEGLDDEGVKPMEGVVTAVNRRDRTISIRLADGTRRMLRLSNRVVDEVDAAIDRAGDGTARVILFVKDEAGERVVHYIKRVS
jgi:hypothetical protein